MQIIDVVIKKRMFDLNTRHESLTLNRDWKIAFCLLKLIEWNEIKIWIRIIAT